MSQEHRFPRPGRQAWGVIVAAGRGRRFGRPKQFASVLGHPLLWYSLSAFDRCPAISGWTVVTLAEQVNAVRRLCTGFRRCRTVVPGGMTRADSVRSGLDTLPDQGLAVIHDAARPLITPAMLNAGIALCARVPVTYAVPVGDSLKRVVSGRVVATVARDGIWAVQTPQFFPLALLRRAYRAAGAEAITAADDCRLVELLGVKPRVLTSPLPNPKVTWPADITLVEKLL